MLEGDRELALPDRSRWLARMKATAVRAADAGRALPALCRRPRLTLLWLRTARRAQIALPVVVLALHFIVPPILGVAADWLYPSYTPKPNFIQRALGRSPKLPDPMRKIRYEQFVSASWVIGFGIVIVFLLDHVPAAIVIGRERAHSLLAEAEKTAAFDVEKSVMLRREASGLLVDEPQSDQGRDAAEPANGAAKTHVMSRPGSGDATKSAIGSAGRYVLDKPLGSGGMGVVYAGQDTRLNRTVALKQLFGHLAPDAEYSDRFRQEALALASLAHPNIVPIYDLVEDDGQYWIVMEMLRGGSLGDRIGASAPGEVAEAIETGAAIASGLAYAHDRGFIHRDVKPMNILFGEDGTPKLTDFGNAKSAESIVHTQEGAILGSPAYMSPEQVAGTSVDHRSDIYSLGITLYQVLTGCVPFEGDLREILAQHVSREPPAPRTMNPDVSVELDRIVMTMLAKEPADRFRSCHDVVAALRDIMS